MADPIILQDLLDLAKDEGIDPLKVILVHDTAGVGSGPITRIYFDLDCPNVMILESKPKAEPFVPTPDPLDDGACPACGMGNHYVDQHAATCPNRVAGSTT